MNNELSMTNESFSFLKSSSEFLNLILNNINSCVLLLDKDVRLRAFNDSLLTIFPKNKDGEILFKRCGEAIGCAYQIEEHKNCGETSQCRNCDLRIAAIKSYMNNEIVYREDVIKPFFDNNNNKVEKNLQFSTRLFEFNKDKYIVMIIEEKFQK